MDNLSSADNEFLSKVYQNIEENLGDELFTVEKLAEALNISRSMLHRKLKQLTGKSATATIKEKRLTLAKEKLENKSGTAAQIAYEVGFSSPSYFNKVFKKHYQISPGEVGKGKKVITGQQWSDKLKVRCSIKRPALIFLLVLLAIALIWAGIHFSKVKTNRSDITIAILPFDNLSQIENTQYFADGVVEDLLGRLTTIKDIKVISRTSSEMFREKGGKTVPEIGKLLGASHIVEGTVQRVANDIRISVQLINTKTDNHILSRQYDRSLSNFFQTQSEIANEIASELSLALTNTELETLKKEQTQSLQAFEYYQLGRFHSSKRRVEELHKGIEYYEKALEIDPDYAQAYAGLADSYYLLNYYDSGYNKERRKKAYEMLYKALEIDPDLAEAHTMLGEFYQVYDWDWEKAEKEFQLALIDNSNFSTTHQYYAELLDNLGRNDEAREHIDIAKKLDPFSGIIRFQSARFYYIQEEFEKALKEIQICFDMDLHDGINYEFVFRLYLQLGDSLAALENFKKLGEFTGYFSPDTADSIYWVDGFNGIDRWSVETNNYIGSEIKASIYARLGEDEKALELIEMAVEDHAFGGGTDYLEFKHLYSNPRFKAIRKKMGLPPLAP